MEMSVDSGYRELDSVKGGTDTEWELGEAPDEDRVSMVLKSNIASELKESQVSQAVERAIFTNTEKGSWRGD